MERCRAIVFDLDGTLVDSYGPITASLNAARATRGLPPVSEDQVRLEVGHGLESLVERHLGREHVERGVQAFRDAYARLYAAGTRPLPGVPEIPRRLHARGLRLAVASNKLAKFGRPIVAQVGLADVIPVVLGPDCGVPTKPSPEMLELALRELGVAPAEALYVGDMPLDVESARRAGLRHFVIPTGSADRATLLATPGACVLDDLAAVEAQIESVAGA